ncbi:MAG: beta-hydroxyacyl-ACP dehydratase [Bacteroidaceae bacterium]|nr:beta-hydroxyacyl-ACP dehydratase [Bacteroidaceae bacterium]
MLLKDKYYELLAQHPTGPLSATFRLKLKPDCTVYEGHFPGNPVCPGVCNMEAIRECCSMLTGQPLHIASIKQCRLTAVATPQLCPELDVSVQAQPLDEGYSVTAKITAGETTYMDFRGTLNAQPL